MRPPVSVNKNVFELRSKKQGETLRTLISSNSIAPAPPLGTPLNATQQARCLPDQMRSLLVV